METTFRIQVGPSYHSGWMRLDGESKKEYIFSYLDNFRKNNQTCTCTSASALCGISFTFLKIRELHNKYVVIGPHIFLFYLVHKKSRFFAELHMWIVKHA